MLPALMSKLQLKKQLFTARHELLKRYLASLDTLMGQNLLQAPLMAIDLEMTGLDPLTDQILSIGIIPIINGQLRLDSAEHKFLQIDGSVGDSAAIHGIMDNHLDDGLSLVQAMNWLLEQCQGKVLVAHHGPLDVKFIQQGLRQVFGESVSLPVIDTLTTERKRLLRQHEMIQEGALRLGACRARYHLPVYNAHNALVDALACGELFLAQSQAIGDPSRLKLSDIMVWL